MQFSGRVAVVFGGYRGIGRATGELLLARGVKVCLADVEDVGKTVVQDWTDKYGNDTAIFAHCDVTKDDDITAVFAVTHEKLGQVEIVVSNAGYINEHDWHTCVDVNLNGLIRITNTALTHMSRENGRPGGVIVSTSSIGGVAPVLWGPVYAATKAAIVNYVRSWAAQENITRTGVRFNCVCPTQVDSGFIPLSIQPDKVHNYHVVNDSCLPPDQILKSEEVGEVILGLVEDEQANGRTVLVSSKNGQEEVLFHEYAFQ